MYVNHLGKKNPYVNECNEAMQCTGSVAVQDPIDSVASAPDNNRHRTRTPQIIQIIQDSWKERRLSNRIQSDLTVPILLTASVSTRWSQL